MRMVDIWAAVPFLLVALVVAVVLGSSLAIMMALLALLAWSGFVRNVRAEVLSLKERDYVKLAQVAGASTPRVLIKHVFPGITNTMVVIATLNVGGLILAEATLSFPWRRHPRAEGDVGPDDQRGAALPFAGVVDHRISGHGHIPGGDVAELPRRLAAGLPGPAVKAALRRIVRGVKA